MATSKVENQKGKGVPATPHKESWPVPCAAQPTEVLEKVHHAKCGKLASMPEQQAQPQLREKPTAQHAVNHQRNLSIDAKY